MATWLLSVPEANKPNRFHKNFLRQLLYGNQVHIYSYVDIFLYEYGNVDVC